MAIAPLPDPELLDVLTATRPPLRLLSHPGEGGRAADRVGGARRPARAPHSRQGWSAARRARLRRTGLLGVLVGLLGALVVPVSALAGAPAPSLSHGAIYTVAPGDTLGSIARRLNPTDPRPIVGQLIAETGSDSVVAGEHISLP